MSIIPDSLQEIAATLRRNKLRTVLTGFAVAWGVVLLVVLLSSGQGFQRAMEYNMKNQGGMQKNISVSIGSTSLPYRGLKANRSIHMTYRDLEELVAAHRDVIDAFSAQGVSYKAGFALTYRSQTTTDDGSVYGTTPGKVLTDGLRIYAGRFLNEADMVNARKSMVIEKETAIELFGSPQEAVGKMLAWRSILFTVVGVTNKSSGGIWQHAYIPLSTLQFVLHSDATRWIDQFSLLCNGFADAAEASVFCNSLRSELQARYDVNPKDEYAIYVSNGLEDSETTREVFAGIALFLWLIGFSTLLIGLIGVANIMQITVTERSAEIGIRKALGAKPRAIIAMILRESVLITVLAGCIGLSIGVGMMAIVSWLMERYNIGTQTIEETTITLFRDPLIGFGTAVGILVLMTLCGAIAGYLPARRAVKIPAVEAMRK